jgi:outer membrane lipoprotein carrier protein
MMNKDKYHIVTVLLLSILLSVFTDLIAQEKSARDQLFSFSEDLSSLQARFKQTVIGTDGNIEDSSNGQVWMSQPDFFRWQYGGEYPELVVADGEQIWIYDEILEQVTVKPQSDFAADSPLSLLTDINRIDEQFEVREAGEMDGMHLLELRSLSQESEFDRVLLGLRDNELVMMTMEDAFGLRTEIRFSDLQINQNLEPELFSFVPPAGVDVIGALQTDQFDP